MSGNQKPDTTKKILITGATGFIGKHAANTFAKSGYNVHALTRRELSNEKKSQYHSSITFHKIMIDVDSIKTVLTQTNPDLVIHLGCHYLAEHQSADILELISGNLSFGTLLLEAMSLCQIKKFINIGTDWQHFDNKEYSPYSLYASLKQAFQDVLIYYAEVKNLSAITIELGDTYASDDERPKLLNLLRRTARTKEPLELSGGEQWIDLVHVDDVVAGLEIAVYLLWSGTENYSVFRLTSREQMTIRDLVNQYQLSTGESLDVLWGKKPYRSRERWVPSNYGKILPGWSQKIPLTLGIKHFHDYTPKTKKRS